MELESRIRNLGGKYQCFAMPYWEYPDATTSDIFDVLGGNSDPDNGYTVNEFGGIIQGKNFG